MTGMMTKREVNEIIKGLKLEILLVGKNKRQFDRQLKIYDATSFTGRIETNEIKRARAEQLRLANIICDLNSEKKRYERIKQEL